MFSAYNRKRVAGEGKKELFELHKITCEEINRKGINKSFNIKKL